MNTRIVYALILLLASVSAFADDTRLIEYSWLTSDRITGYQTVSYERDGLIRIQFAYSDRGRGPAIESTLQLNQEGVPTQFSATGNNNAKATIDEQFFVEKNKAIWRSSVERGQRVVAGDEFYFPNNSSPEVMAVLARALLKSPDKSMVLLPSGHASIEEVASVDVALDGEPQRIVLYGIEGLNPEPTYIWLDDNNDLFGFTDRSFGIVRKGWEPSFPTLKSAEREAADLFFKKSSDALTTELSGLTVVTGARIFDSISAELTAPATVFIWDGLISAVYFYEIDLPEDATVIDATGMTLMPSLWDMHNHVVPGYLLNYLASGVTNVRDTGSNHSDIWPLIDKIRGESFAGPDIYPLGFIDKRGEHAAPVGMLVDNLDEARDAVDFYAQRGYRGIKLYSSIEPEWVSPIAELAHERGMPVAGHVPAYMSAEQAIRSGFDEITHVNMVLLNFLGAQELDTRTPNRFLVPGIQSSGLDIESEEVREFLSLMKENHIAHDTTLAVIIEMFRNKPGELSHIFSGIADNLPVFVRRKLVMTEGYNQGHEEAFARSSNTVLSLIAKMHKDGVRLLPGTDNILPGFTLIRELIYYAEAGIPVNEVLQLGTIEPARQLGLDHRLGSISVGKEAHMYLVDGNPIEDINTLYRVEHVFKGRQLFYAPDLLRAQGFVPF